MTFTIWSLLDSRNFLTLLTSSCYTADDVVYSKNFRHNSGLGEGEIFIHAMLLIYLAVVWKMNEEAENGSREFLLKLEILYELWKQRKIQIPTFLCDLWATFSSMMQNSGVGILGRRNTFPRFLYIIKSPNIHVDVVYALLHQVANCQDESQNGSKGGKLSIFHHSNDGSRNVYYGVK